MGSIARWAALWLRGVACPLPMHELHGIEPRLDAVVVRLPMQADVPAECAVGRCTAADNFRTVRLIRGAGRVQPMSSSFSMAASALPAPSPLQLLPQKKSLSHRA